MNRHVGNNGAVMSHRNNQNDLQRIRSRQSRDPLMKKLALLSAVFVSALPQVASSQEILGAMMKGVGQSAIDRAEKLIESAPDQLENFLSKSETGHIFASKTECLGHLQVAVNAGAITANILPFSRVSAFEDDRGPVGRFRILLNGEKVHVEMFCEGETLTTTSLDWHNDIAVPVASSPSTFDAAAGILLLMQMQEAFKQQEASKKQEVAKPETPGVFRSKPKKDGASQSSWERVKGTPYAKVRSTRGPKSQLYITCNVSHMTSPSVHFHLIFNDTLLKKGKKITLLTTTDKISVDTLISAVVAERKATNLNQVDAISLVSALAVNEVDQFLISVDTFSGPISVEFPMDGFAAAMEPVVEYCPVAASAMSVGQ